MRKLKFLSILALPFLCVHSTSAQGIGGGAGVGGSGGFGGKPYVGWQIQSGGSLNSGALQNSVSSVTISSYPITAGNTVACSVRFAFSVVTNKLNSVTDSGGGNTFTVSSGIELSSSTLIYTAYVIGAAAESSVTLTFNLTTSTGTPQAENTVVAVCDQFIPPTGSHSLDTTKTATNGSGGTVTTAAFSTAQASELLYGSMVGLSSSGSWTAGLAGGASMNIAQAAPGGNGVYLGSEWITTTSALSSGTVSAVESGASGQCAIYVLAIK